MQSILVLNSSPSPQSVSGVLVDKAASLLARAHPGARFVTQDLAAAPLPHLPTIRLAGIRFAPRAMFEIEARSRADALISELRRADLVLVGAPAHDRRAPASLRAWFDHVVRPDETFRYGGQGSSGLMTGKRAIVVGESGHRRPEGDESGMPVDFQAAYLRQLFGFMGIVDIDFVHAGTSRPGTEARAAAIAGAEAALERLIGGKDALAA